MSYDIRREEGALYTPEPHLRAGHSRQHQLHSLWARGGAGWPQGSGLQMCWLWRHSRAAARGQMHCVNLGAGSSGPKRSMFSR